MQQINARINVIVTDLQALANQIAPVHPDALLSTSNVLRRKQWGHESIINETIRTEHYTVMPNTSASILWRLNAWLTAIDKHASYTMFWLHTTLRAAFVNSIFATSA